MPRVRRRLVLSAFVFAVALMLYIPSLHYGFVWDDRSLILENRYLHDPGQLAQNLTGDFFRRSEDPTTIGHWRPLVTATYMADWALDGGRPRLFHAHNAFLHGVCAALLALLAIELGFSDTAALAAGLLFAVLPAHVEAVAWISGRTDLLCGLFVILALVLDVRASRTGRLPGRGLAAASTFLALLAKEMAVVVPVATALRAVLLPGEGESSLRPGRRAWRAAWPHLAAIATYAAVRFGILGIAPKEAAAAGAGRFALFLTWWSAFLEYVRVLVWPVHLGIVPTVALERSIFAPRVVAGVALFVLAAAAAWRLRRRVPVASWSMACFLASFAPVANVVVAVRAPAGVDFPWAERFLFVPTFFAALAAAAIVLPQEKEGAPARGRPFVVAAVTALIVLFAGRSILREEAWKSQRALFEATVRDTPGDSLAQATLGAALDDAGDTRAAEEHYREAIRLAPENAIAHFDLGNLLRARGDLDSAEAEYREAIRIRPAYPQAWLNLGLVEASRGRFGGAMDAFRRADAAMGGKYPAAKADMAALLKGTGHPDEAIPLYEEALRLDPDLAAARAGLEAARRAAGGGSAR